VDVTAALEVVEYCIACAKTQAATITDSVLLDMYLACRRFWLSAGNHPVHFRAMIPGCGDVCPAIVCGIRIILNRPKRDPSVPLDAAQNLLERSRPCPMGIIQVVNGDKEAV